MPRINVLILVVLSLAGCTTTQLDREISDASVEAVAEASREPRDVPDAETTHDLLLPREQEQKEAAPAEERFDISVEDAPARQLLLSLVADTDTNMVVHPKVDTTVSLELQDVSVPEVLEILREVYGLEYKSTSAGYIVHPPSPEHRIYEINYLDVKRRGSSRTHISSGQSTESSDLQDEDLLTGRRLDDNGEDSDERDGRETGTRIETRTESAFWDSIKTTLGTAIGCEIKTREDRRTVTCGPNRNLVVNSQAGIVTVYAEPRYQRMVEEIIHAIENSVQRQVILEAKIVEVELRDAFRSGINWSALATLNGQSLGFGQVAGENLFEDGAASTRGSPIDVVPGQIREGFESSAFGGTSYLTANTSDFNAFIELLETQGSTRVLSSPRVATVNNQKAVIKVGTDEFFVTGVTSRTASGGVGTTAASTVELTPFFSGIALDVTPQISKDGEVILHVHPTVSEVTDQTKTFTVSGEQESLPLAFSSVRESDSIIRAQNGQLVVIGGLMKDQSRQDRLGTPLLSRIPLIGEAFRSRQERVTKTELVILLRPIVVDSASDWRRSATDPLERMRSFDNRQSTRQ